MKTKLLIGIVTALIMIGAFTKDALALNLLNGSFEEPAVPLNTYEPVTPTSWTWDGPSGVVFNGTVFNPVEGSNWPSPMDGQQFVDIGNTSILSLSQTFIVTLAGAYQFTWYDNAHSNGLTSP